MSTNTEIKKGTLFVKEVLSRLAGNTDDALASKVARKAISALQGQIASLKGRQVEAEITLEDAKEALENAIYPTEVFASPANYTSAIVKAQACVTGRESDLEDVVASLKYFEDLLEKVQSESV